MSKKLDDASKKMLLLHQSLRQSLPVPLGETAAPGYKELSNLVDPTRKALNEDYMRIIAPEYRALAEAVKGDLAAVKPFPAAPPIPDENLWLWGGPTPEWGGSLQPDTLVRTADWFNIQNGIYVYGPTTEEMIALHAPLKKLICMVTTTCRAPGQQPETDAECAEKLSKLSLKYSNIFGGMMDDMTAGNPDGVAPEKVKQVKTVSKALKKHNKALKLYGTVYQHELGKKDFSPLLPHLDGIALWFWYQEKLLELEKYVDMARKNFPKKEILLGLFLHDYGTSDAAALTDLLIHQLKGARALLAAGKIGGLIILGDREILKWPEQAGAVKGFLAAR